METRNWFKSVTYATIAAFILVGCSSGPEVEDTAADFESPNGRDITLPTTPTSSSGSNSTNSPIEDTSDETDDLTGDEDEEEVVEDPIDTNEELAELINEKFASLEAQVSEAEDSADGAKKTALVGAILGGLGLAAGIGGTLWLRNKINKNRELNEENAQTILANVGATNAQASSANAAAQGAVSTARAAYDQSVQNSSSIAEAFDASSGAQTAAGQARSSSAKLELLRILDTAVASARYQDQSYCSDQNVMSILAAVVASTGEQGITSNDRSRAQQAIDFCEVDLSARSSGSGASLPAPIAGSSAPSSTPSTAASSFDGEFTISPTAGQNAGNIAGTYQIIEMPGLGTQVFKSSGVARVKTLDTIEIAALIDHLSNVQDSGSIAGTGFASAADIDTTLSLLEEMRSSGNANGGTEYIGSLEDDGSSVYRGDKVESLSDQRRTGTGG